MLWVADWLADLERALFGLADLESNFEAVSAFVTCTSLTPSDRTGLGFWKTSRSPQNLVLLGPVGAESANPATSASLV